jgi:hypothetical protein
MKVAKVTKRSMAQCVDADMQEHPTFLGKGAPKKQRCSRSSFTMLGQSTQSWWANIYGSVSDANQHTRANYANSDQRRTIWIQRPRRGVGAFCRSPPASPYSFCWTPPCARHPLQNSSRFIRRRRSTVASEIPTCPTPLPRGVPARRSPSRSRGWGRMLLPDCWGGLSGVEEEGSPARAQFRRGAAVRPQWSLSRAMIVLVSSSFDMPPFGCLSRLWCKIIQIFMDKAGGEKRRKSKCESSDDTNFLNPMGPFWIKSYQWPLKKMSFLKAVATYCNF